MKSKQEYIDKVLNNENFKKSLENLEDKDQKEKVKNLTLDLTNKIADAFLPLIEKIEKDEEFAKELKEKLEKALNKK